MWVADYILGDISHLRFDQFIWLIIQVDRYLARRYFLDSGACGAPIAMAKALEAYDSNKFAPCATILMKRYPISLDEISRPDCEGEAGTKAADKVFSNWGGKRVGGKKRRAATHGGDQDGFKQARNDVVTGAYAALAPQTAENIAPPLVHPPKQSRHTCANCGEGADDGADLCRACTNSQPPEHFEDPEEVQPMCDMLHYALICCTVL
jgi:hypothetical protein